MIAFATPNRCILHVFLQVLYCIYTVNIIFFSTILLSKNRNGGEVASQFFIDALRQSGHQVTVVGYLRKGDALEHDPQQTIVVAERYTETQKSKLYLPLWMLLSFILNLPYSAAKFISWSYIQQARRLLSQQVYDAVIIDHAQMGWLLNYIKIPKILILNAHNVEHEIYAENQERSQNLAAKLIYRRESQAIQQLETRLAERADQIWTLTQRDATYFSKLNLAGAVKQFDIPPGLKPLPQSLPKTHDIGLIASWSWRANEEALQWFLAEIYPHLPLDVTIQVAGKGADWLADRYANIDYLGIVPDAQIFMAQARVVAIPTLSGGGIQIKTLDAIASGSRIVATAVGLRGITNPPATIQVADSPTVFAQSLLAALSAPLAADQADQTAATWSKTRQTQFLAEIAAALAG